MYIVYIISLYIKSGNDFYGRQRVKQREISSILLHSLNFMELLLFEMWFTQSELKSHSNIQILIYMVIVRVIVGPVRFSPSYFFPIIPFLFNFWKLNMKFGFMSGQQLCVFVKQHLAQCIFGLENQLLANEWGGGLMCVGPAAGSIKSSAHSRAPLTPPSHLLISKWRPWLLLQHLLKGKSPPPLSPLSSGIGRMRLEHVVFCVLMTKVCVLYILVISIFQYIRVTIKVFVCKIYETFLLLYCRSYLSSVNRNKVTNTEYPCVHRPN